MAKKVAIIADAGINPKGNPFKAHLMIDLIKDIGADTVKFQTVNADIVYRKEDPLYKIFKEAEFSPSVWKELKHHADSVGIEFLSTPGDKESVDLLNELGVKRFKVASDSFSNIDFVNYIISKGKPILVSTGMARGIGEICGVVDKYNCPPAVLFHCVSKYPPEPGELELRRIRLLRDFFTKDTAIGYSDHMPWIESALAGVVKGARVIEKHFKISDDEIDAPVSLNSTDFTKMVESIRRLEQIL